MKRLLALWNDEDGFVLSSELVLIATVLVLGSLVGLVSLRNQIVGELSDMSQAIGSIGKREKPDEHRPSGISVSVWPAGAPRQTSGAES